MFFQREFIARTALHFYTYCVVDATSSAPPDRLNVAPPSPHNVPSFVDLAAFGIKCTGSKVVCAFISGIPQG